MRIFSWKKKSFFFVFLHFLKIYIKSKKGVKILSSETIEELFPENPSLGNKIYQFMRYNSINSFVTFEEFSQGGK